jgi:hypothetical protein
METPSVSAGYVLAECVFDHELPSENILSAAVGCALNSQTASWRLTHLATRMCPTASPTQSATPSHVFTASDALSQTMQFTKSKAFSKSKAVTDSNAFTRSEVVTKSNALADSVEFGQSNPFDDSGVVTLQFTVGNFVLTHHGCNLIIRSWLFLLILGMGNN